MTTDSIVETVPSQVMQILDTVKRLPAKERLLLAKLVLESILINASEQVDWATLMADTSRQEQDDAGWPPGFFEATAGAWAGETLVREEQGDYEIRDELV